MVTRTAGHPVDLNASIQVHLVIDLSFFNKDLEGVFLSPAHFINFSLILFELPVDLFQRFFVLGQYFLVKASA